jgi:hypothetical protein
LCFTALRVRGAVDDVAVAFKGADNVADVEVFLRQGKHMPPARPTLTEDETVVLEDSDELFKILDRESLACSDIVYPDR